MAPRPGRREFLATAAGAGAVGVAGVLGGVGGLAMSSAGQPEPARPAQPVKPEEKPAPADGAGAPGAAAITAATIAEAEKLAGIEFTDSEREMMAGSIARQVSRLRSRQKGPELENQVAPATVFNPRYPGWAPPEARRIRWSFESAPPEPLPRRYRLQAPPPPPLPTSDEDIAFAPLSMLARWIREGVLTSERLTRLYLERLKQHDPKLLCVVTLTEELALEQARRADHEIVNGPQWDGGWRGPLHGIPWGAKDLFDTAGIATTWGAEPFADRVPSEDAAVVERLQGAGAVLVAKLSLGALANGDVWQKGKTRNPWDTEKGSSGSSAGSASATAAGLVGFSLGTETWGSIMSPCMACGTTGLRPTFGRVSRRGAMALSWSLDKVGPICRGVEDCMMVLDAIRGQDPADPSTVEQPLNFDGSGGKAAVAGKRVGYDPAWFDEKRSHALDRAALEACKRVGLELVEISMPDWPYETLQTILISEAAGAFEELTRSGRDDMLKRQDAGAWPNVFRQAWFIPAIELVQAERFRRRVCGVMKEKLDVVEALICPSQGGSMSLITNNTGHPALTLRCGFKDDGMPHGITLYGRLYDEGTLCRIGMELEAEFGVRDTRPSL